MEFSIIQEASNTKEIWLLTGADMFWNYLWDKVQGRLIRSCRMRVWGNKSHLLYIGNQITHTYAEYMIEQASILFFKKLWRPLTLFKYMKIK